MFKKPFKAYFTSLFFFCIAASILNLIIATFLLNESSKSVGIESPNINFPIIKSDSAIDFAVIGDFGQSGSGEADVVNLIDDWHPDFIITTGDNNYPLGADETMQKNVDQYFADYINSERFFPSLGNHDWGTDSAKPYLDFFPISLAKANSGSSHNERYYDFIQGPIHFFVLDSDKSEPDGVTVDSIQALWLKDQLASSTSPWKVVYFHHPPFSSGRHGSNEWMQWPFASWGVDAVLSGHDHVYERLVIDNIPYFVNGLGGRGTRKKVSSTRGSEFFYSDNYGAMRVSADETQLIFAFYSIDNPQSPLDLYVMQVDTIMEQN